MGEVINKNIVEEYTSYINDILTALGFTKIDDNYELTATVSGGSVVINGQQIHQQPIIIKKVISIKGPGYCCNIDDTSWRDILWVSFETYQEDNLVDIYDEGLYCDEKEYFNKLIHQWV
jgi:hypothetical protein